MTKTYTTATIGPIIDTLDATRKTRELWGASYLFSYIIKEICLKLRNNEIEILLPHWLNDAEWKNNLGAGLFPDKIICEGEVDIRSIYEMVIGETSLKINSHKRLEDEPLKSSMKDFLLQYFRFISVSFDCENENIISKSTALLDSKELRPQIIAENLYADKENPLFYFLYHINESFLFKEGFDNTISRFLSLIEISSRELKHLDTIKYKEIEKIIENPQTKFEVLEDEIESGQDKLENLIIEKLNQLYGSDFRQTHKYIAIVHADGDKIGKMVEKVGSNKESIQSFSLKLLEYSKKATKIVSKYGGSPVYMGGDDMLFFAPLTYKVESQKTTILDLIDALDKEFIYEIRTYSKDVLDIPEEELPSLSFGVSLSYYKFPLYEAKQMSFKALFEEIKWASDKKNAVNLKFRKHSGQMLELFISKKDRKMWENTISFIRDNLNEDALFINSFTHKLRLQSDVLFKIDENLLAFYFENNYNENWEKHKTFFTSIIEFLKLIRGHVEKEKQEEFLYSVLRFIHFIRS